MSDYPSWSDERDSYSDANWSAPAAAPQHYGGGGGGGYPGADYTPEPYANRGGGGGGYGGYENRGSAGYGSAGGGGGYGGGGGGYNSNSSYVPPPNKPVGAAKSSEISFDTSSRDPAHLRSRVFIGCLGQSGVVREDIIELCRPFGALMAVTLFKGYAFVQFEHAEDADQSCEVLNGKRWKGVNIDVHLAMEGLVRKTLPAKRGADGGRGGARGGGMVGRGGGAAGAGGGAGGYGAAASNVNDYQGQQVKRARPSALVGMGPSGMGDEALIEVNEQNKKSAQADTGVPEMIGTEMADTLICGTCRYVTSDFVAFREHRKKQCVKPKESVEPPVLRCASCGLRFLSAWKMLFHLTDFHRMQLFKPDYSEEALERAKTEDDRYKQVSATRMEAWRAEQIADTTAFVVQQPVAATTTVGENGGGTPKQPAAAPAAAAAARPAAAQQQQQQSFAHDDDVDTFGGPMKKREAGRGGGGRAGQTNGNTAGASSAQPVERMTTGADYDEDEEDEDDGRPSTIPSLCQ